MILLGGGVAANTYLQSELNKIGIYIAGEMISDHQGWVEGAIRSVDKLKL